MLPAAPVLSGAASPTGSLKGEIRAGAQGRSLQGSGDAAQDKIDINDLLKIEEE